MRPLFCESVNRKPSPIEEAISSAATRNSQAWASARRRPENTAGTTAGDAAIGLVLADEDLLCEDLESAPPLGWDLAKERDYRTFISVSVIAGDTAYGMLTLDAVEPGTLDVEDKALLRLMAGVLAVALSIP